MAEAVTLGENRARDFACRGCIQRDVEEPGTSNLDRRNSVNRGKGIDQISGQITRVDANFLRQLHRNRCRPVAVIAILRALQRDNGIVDVNLDIDTARPHNPARNLSDCTAQRFGVHPLIVVAPHNRLVDRLTFKPL